MHHKKLDVVKFPEKRGYARKKFDSEFPKNILKNF